MLTCPSPEQLRRLLAHQLADEDFATLEAHLEGCAPCQQTLEDLTRAVGSGVSEGEAPAAPPCPTFLDPLQGPLPPSQLPTRPSNAKAPAARPPEVPGYELLGELGRGGMGVVYRARHLRLGRLVALKMILAGAHTRPEHRARFQMEAEAVAGLQHPNVVQLYEAGEHDGCPYLAMEYVDGGSLQVRLSTSRPSPREAAGLVATLADALRCAHERGIIHRDLKPANVLLTADGVPKVTDFGLAKRFEEDAGRTDTGTVLGTPNYMPPEQAGGHPRAVGPAADVYALGAILYECLTGRPPFCGDSVLDTLEQVRTREPPPPRQLQRRVPRDLETICLKCLQKEPARRYTSAAALGDDLRRFLGNEPIRARPVGLPERAAKWARRRPAWAVLLLVVAVTAVGSVVAGVLYNARLRREVNRAEEGKRTAMQAVEDMLTEVAEKDLAEEPRTEDKRRRLLERALALYQKLLQDQQDDPAMRKETGLAHRRLADILRLLGRNREAEDAYGRAITLLGDLAARYPSAPEFRQALADCHNWRGELMRTTGRPAEARADYDSARRLQERLVADFPDTPDYRRDLARTHYNRGILLGETRELKAALREFREAIDRLQALAAQHPGRPEYRQHLARTHLNRGRVQRADGDAGGAEASYREAIRLLEQLRDADPNKPDYRHELGAANNNLGNLYSTLKRPPEAKEHHRTAIGLFKQLTVDFPRTPVYRSELANSYNSLGAVHVRSKEWGAAQKAWQQARDLQREMVREFHDMPGYRADLGRTLRNLGYLGLKRNEAGAACRCLAEGAEHLEAAVRANPANEEDYRDLRALYRDLATAIVRRGDHAEARRRAAALPRALPDGDRGYYLAACFLARCAAAVKKAPSLSPAERAALIEDYAGQVRALLRQAGGAARGNLAKLKDDKDFAPFAGRNDVLELLGPKVAAVGH